MTSPEAEPVISMGVLDAAVKRFERGVRSTEAHLPVLSCPGWTVEELVHHLGEVHQWAAAAVRERTITSPPAAADHAPTALAPTDLATWYRQHADALIEELRRAGPDAPAWNFADPAGGGAASWWLRRQVHETVMHTWDLGTAGDVPALLDPARSWDAVLEVRDVFYPRQVRLERIEPLPAALVLTPTDLETEPAVIGEGERRLVTGDAASLMLLVWQRIPYTGDADTAALLARPLTP